MMGLLPCAFAPLVDLLQQVLDVPVPELGLQLVQQLLKRTHWIFGDLPHLLLVLEILPDALSNGRRWVDGRQPFNGGLSMLHLHLVDGTALIRNLVLKKLHPILQLMVLLSQALIFVLEKHQFLKDIAHMLLRRRSCILLKLKVILKPLDFSLKIGYNDLILAVDLSLIVLLAEVDPLVQFTDHRVCLTIQVVEIGVLGQLDAGGVAFCDAVYHGLQIGVVGVGGSDLGTHVLFGDTIAIYLSNALHVQSTIPEMVQMAGQNHPKYKRLPILTTMIQNNKEGRITAVRSPAPSRSQRYYSVETPISSPISSSR